MDKIVLVLATKKCNISTIIAQEKQSIDQLTRDNL